MKLFTILITSLCGIALAAPIAKKSDARKQPVEVGEVKWGRDFEAALEQSKKSKKPVFLLFQEVPGCAGCKQFGREVLSHPLIVEAIEAHFVPMLVRNNKTGGDDEKILKRFGEPAWNYQVVRFLNAQGKDILPRKDKVWSTKAIAGRMIATLESADQEVPEYLRGLAPVGKVEQAAFAMHCFWTGEFELGKIEGVVATEAGWIDGREVTLVDYLPEKISLDDLTKKASAKKCASKVYPDPGKGYRAAKPSDQAKQIERLDMEKIPGLTKLQKTKLNSFWRGDQKKAKQWLSPRQREALEDMLR